jgi:hypothetical protein
MFIECRFIANISSVRDREKNVAMTPLVQAAPARQIAATRLGADLLHGRRVEDSAPSMALRLSAYRIH